MEAGHLQGHPVESCNIKSLLMTTGNTAYLEQFPSLQKELGELLTKHPRISLLPSNDGTGTRWSMYEVSWLMRMRLVGTGRTGPKQPWQRAEEGAVPRSRRSEEKPSSCAVPREGLSTGDCRQVTQHFQVSASSSINCDQYANLQVRLS